MGFYNQFKKFDPKTGNAPSHPFSYLPAIASRARWLLKDRTSEQIESVASDIDWMISEYFSEIRCEAISRLQANSGDDEFEMYFEWDGSPKGDGQWRFKDAREDDLEIATANNTSEVEALKECEGWFLEIGGKDIPEVKPCEVFAVLSLWMLADAIGWLRHQSSEVEMAFHASLANLVAEIEAGSKRAGIPIISQKTEDVKVNFSLAGGYALNAMDAVCYAEHLHKIDRLEAAHTLKIAKTQGDYLNKEAEQRSMRAKELNIARHRKTYEVKDMVIEEWKKKPSAFPSAEKAGLHFADWLETKGIKYEPRTVTTWIRDYAKKIGLRLR